MGELGDLSGLTPSTTSQVTLEQALDRFDLSTLLTVPKSPEAADWHLIVQNATVVQDARRGAE